LKPLEHGGMEDPHRIMVDDDMNWKLDHEGEKVGPQRRESWTTKERIGMVTENENCFKSSMESTQMEVVMRKHNKP